MANKKTELFFIFLGILFLSAFLAQSAEAQDVWQWTSTGCGDHAPCTYRVCSQSECYSCRGILTALGEKNPQINENPKTTQNFICQLSATPGNDGDCPNSEVWKKCPSGCSFEKYYQMVNGSCALKTFDLRAPCVPSDCVNGRCVGVKCIQETASICGNRICEGSENSAHEVCTTNLNPVCYTVKNCAADCGSNSALTPTPILSPTPNHILPPEILNQPSWWQRFVNWFLSLKFF